MDLLKYKTKYEDRSLPYPFLSSKPDLTGVYPADVPYKIFTNYFSIIHAKKCKTLFFYKMLAKHGKMKYIKNM